MSNPFSDYVDLAQPRLGSEVVYATDDFFADKSRLIDPRPPIFIDDKFDDHGKWMDGWESRRKRVPGHDHAVIKLGVPGRITGVDINTAFFTGNYPPAASLEACFSREDIPAENDWQEILPGSDLNGDSHHYLEIADDRQFSHLRLHIYPDGGIARLRVYGEILPDWRAMDTRELIDLLAVENGGRALVCNDQHFGTMHNLTAPGRGVNMGDGWETARRRGPGHDWVVLALGHPGVIEEIEIDTAHFKGNYPDRVSIQAILSNEQDPLPLEAERTAEWPILLAESKLEMDQIHTFTELNQMGPISHIRMNILPDGGISRLRLRGRLAGAR